MITMVTVEVADTGTVILELSMNCHAVSAPHASDRQIAVTCDRQATGGQTGGPTDGRRTDGRTNGRTDRRAVERTGGRKDRRTVGQTGEGQLKR